ncbi:HK97 family phage prohead protease [Bacteroides sp. HPS0048]|jgi:HK97 family phage prohead protease|uniref:HK97 family phage prohead protease n=1 Tax=unclassified Bacteroides TaxID=2646097 RepID=UPI000360F2FC|nr:MULTISPECIES: HK97 family phage prohead protease [unclassified Bacteroides]EOA55591.1 HK97 family phage prohead protease [Bacteroides sp. HPS0048]
MEIRSFTELGAPKITEERIIEGYGIVFNQESKVIYEPQRKLTFIEVIERGAVTEELLMNCDIKAVLEHDANRLLARWRYGSGSLSLSLDDYGLKYMFDSPHTVDGDFAVEMIKRGDIFGSSFRYFTDDRDKGKVTYSKKNGMLLRIVHKIDRIADVSPVSDPAFYGTDVTVRSMDDIEAMIRNKDNDYLTQLATLKNLI